MKTFIQIENHPCDGKSYMMLEEDLIKGYDNDVTYKIPQEIAEKIWGEHPEKEIAKVCKSYSTIEEVEEKYDVDFRDFELQGVQYNVSSEVEPYYYWQHGMWEAELHDSEESFFEQYENNDIWYGLPNGNYEPEWIATGEITLDLEFVEWVKDIEKEQGFVVEWLEKWRDEQGNDVLLRVSNDNCQGSLDEYRFYEEG